MKKFIIGVSLLFPLIAAAAPTCEQDTFQKITNDFQSEVSNYGSKFGISADEKLSQSEDFNDQTVFWRETTARAQALMPEAMFQVYKTHEESYKWLDRIYGQNPTNKELATYHACRKEFFTYELFGSFFEKTETRTESTCDDFITLDERNQLYYELGQQNLSICRAELGSEDLLATDGSSLSEGDSTDTVPVSEPALDFMSQYRVTANEINLAKQAIESIEGSNLTEDDTPDTWWSRIMKSFSRVRTKELTSEQAQLRTTNAIGTGELDDAFQAMRSKRANRKNFWLRTSQKSGEQLDRYQERIGVKMFETLNESIDSVKSSLELIENVCFRQKTITKCWKGPTFPRQDLRSPKSTID